MKTLLCLFAMALAATCVHAATINVPADYGTISEAVTVAGDGDTVLVAPGVYAENINVTKAIVLISAGGAAVTTIDGTGLGSGVLVDFNADIEVRPVLDGFTVTGSIGEGAIQTDESSPIIKNCIVHDNENAGIWGDFSNTDVVDCTIYNNGASGVWFYGSGVCAVTNCWIYNNGLKAQNLEDGANRNGGGVWAQSIDHITIKRCAIVGNYSLNYGGGVMVSTATASEIANCSFRGNQAQHIEGDETGDQICIYGDANAKIVNCLFVGSPENEVDAVAAVFVPPISISYCSFYDVPNSRYANFDLTGAPGLLFVDPQLDSSSPTGLELLSNSPLIDAGDPMTPVPPGGGARVDIGAFEFGGCNHGDVNLDGKLNISDAVAMIGFIFDIYPQPIDPICASVNGDCFVSVADVVYLVNFIFAGGPGPVPNDCK